jgi:hypothetical protein
MTSFQGGSVQNEMNTPGTGATDIQTFVRNRYFYGKLMDVFHFETEQSYFNEKRWLLNRLVSGYGVICGLNVRLTADGKNIWVDPGVALDKAGREILVPMRSKPVAIPEAPPQAAPAPEQGREPTMCDEEGWAHIAICFHECDSDPEPVRAGDCDVPNPCLPGSIRERYRIAFQPWKAPKIQGLSSIEDLFSSGRLNYEALANHITGNCAQFPTDPCIPLANIKLPQAGGTVPVDDIDITIRPIVYTNDLLFELILAAAPQPNRPRPNK